MNSLLSFIVISSVVGTVFFVVLVLLTIATGRVFSKAWHYYMGFIPVFFYLGGVGLVNLITGWLAVSGVHMDTAAPGANEVSSIIGSSNIYFGTSSILNGAFYVQASCSSYPLVSSIGRSQRLQSGIDWILGILNPGDSLGLIIFLFIAWMIGASLYLTVNIKRYLDYRQKLLCQSRTCTSLKSPVPIIISNNTTTPMVIGFIKPLIILPDMDLSRWELDMILAHELVHHKRKDTWVKFAILVARAMHWFNPIVHFLERYMHDLCEQSCDEKVVMEMDMPKRKFYGETILSMLQQATAQKGLVCASGLCNSQKNIKRRLNSMLKAKKMRKIMVALSLALTMVIVGVGGIVAHGFRNDLDHENVYTEQHDETYEDIYTYSDSDPTHVVIPANEIYEGNIVVSDGELTIHGKVIGDITVEVGSVVIISGTGQVYGMVIVNGNLYLTESGVITGTGTRGVVVNHGGVFEMTGGYIRGNSADGNGGGVWINGGTFNMHGGYIEENESTGHGGGVWVDGVDAKFTLYDGVIRNNHSRFSGGGVAVDNATQFTVYGGVIDYNTIANFVSCDVPCTCCLYLN